MSRNLFQVKIMDILGRYRAVMTETKTKIVQMKKKMILRMISLMVHIVLRACIPNLKNLLQCIYQMMQEQPLQEL
jgi:hypothetical protein